MGIRESLLQEFGVRVRIASGTGPKSDPFILEPCSAIEATHTQLETLRCLARRGDYFYRLKQVTRVPEVGAATQLIVFDRAAIGQNGIEEDTVGCCFDASAVTGEPHPWEPLYMWSEPRSPIMLPHELGWLHYSGSRDYSSPGGPLNQSCAYHGPGAAATIYVYEHGMPTPDAASELVAREGEIADVMRQVLAGPDGFRPIRDAQTMATFGVRNLANGSENTIVAVACHGPLFVKARISFHTGPTMMERMTETLGHLAHMVREAFTVSA